MPSQGTVARVVARAITEARRRIRAGRRWGERRITEAGYWARRVSVVNERRGELALGVEGVYLVATKRGLYRVLDGRLTLVLPGIFYGLSYDGQRVFAFEKVARWGRILELWCTSAGEVIDARVLVNGLSPGGHQLDCLDGRLIHCDTYLNRLVELDSRTGRLRGEGFPLGRLDRGRQSANYGHVNSVFLQRDGAWLMCHNETAKTGRPSEILRVDRRFRVRERVPTSAGSAHNVVPFEGDFLFCDSLAGTLRCGERVAFDADLFTRGLSVGRDHLLLGGSAYAARRDRDQAGGALYVLRRADFALVRRVAFPGMVQEIRRIDGPDYGMSSGGNTAD